MITDKRTRLCVHKEKKTKQIIDRGVGPHRQKSVPLILHTCSHGTVRYMCTGSCDSSHSLTSLIHTIIMKGRERSRKAWTPASSLYINGYCWPGETDLVVIDHLHHAMHVNVKDLMPTGN